MFLSRYLKHGIFALPLVRGIRVSVESYLTMASELPKNAAELAEAIGVRSLPDPSLLEIYGEIRTQALDFWSVAVATNETAFAISSFSGDRGPQGGHPFRTNIITKYAALHGLLLAPLGEQDEQAVYQQQLDVAGVRDVEVGRIAEKQEKASGTKSDWTAFKEETSDQRASLAEFIEDMISDLSEAKTKREQLIDPRENSASGHRGKGESLSPEQSEMQKRETEAEKLLAHAQHFWTMNYNQANNVIDEIEQYEKAWGDMEKALGLMGDVTGGWAGQGPHPVHANSMYRLALKWENEIHDKSEFLVVY